MSSDSITFEKRTESSTLKATSVEFRDDVTVITAQGDVGKYGAVYASFELSYNRDGDGGTVSGQGRGVVDKDTFFSGTFSGVWKRDGSNVVMRNLVNISDGNTNLDIIVLNSAERTLSVDVYAVD